MAFLLDEIGQPALDEMLADLLDELGWPVPVDAEVFIAFQACTSVTAMATMGFMAGLPVQVGLATLASDPWMSTYPG